MKAEKQKELLSDKDKELINKSASNSQVDEIENLEKNRDENVRGAKSGGALSEAAQELLGQKPIFKIEKEPIFDAILLNMVLGNSVNLKKKARIKVRDCAVLMGIIDERGLLNEGEIFVSVQRQSFEID